MSRVERSGVALAAILAAACALASSHADAQRLARPFRCDGCISNYFYYDHNASSAVDDWNCGGSTYNGHHASDFSLSGGVASIATGYPVRAAADGVVLFAVDGFPDRCRIGSTSECASGTSCTYDTANYVAIEHSGRTTRYVHLRRGSVRVARREHVTCGQVIGEIGSSGCSSNAHLHFEVRPLSDSFSAAYDPFLGGCSPRTSSAWIAQGRYRGYPGLACPAVTPPPVDAGAALPDSGVATPDAGTTSDAGSAVEPDAGVSTDAAASADAAASTMDAAARPPDAGRVAGDISGGCGCRVGARPQSRTPGLLLLAIAGASLGVRLASRRSRARSRQGHVPPTGEQ